MGSDPGIYIVEGAILNNGELHGTGYLENGSGFCPTNVTLPELLQAAGKRLPQEKDVLLVRQ